LIRLNKALRGSTTVTKLCGPPDTVSMAAVALAAGAGHALSPLETTLLLTVGFRPRSVVRVRIGRRYVARGTRTVTAAGSTFTVNLRTFF
jgi:hypothetical protein